MSASRRFRRQVSRWQWRHPGVEPSAQTRAWVGQLIHAHDDPEVSVEAFIKLAQEWLVYMAARPEAERVEAASLINDHALTHLFGGQVRTVAIGGWPEE